MLRTIQALALLTCFSTVALASCPDLSGDWCGHWDDTKSGHTGKLRGHFEKCGDNAYRVTFTGTFWKIFPFRYTVTLNVVGYEGDKVILEGDSKIAFSSTYHYRAEATNCSFVATYCSKKYEGRFILNR